MKIEIECKIHLDNPERVKALLGELGAEDQGEVYEKNWVFEKGDNELKNSRTLLRLRMHDDDEYGIITHKIPAVEGKFKSRHETETKVESAKNMRLILENLGYRIDWYYEKRRHTFKYEGLSIEIDSTPELGVFLEIEANSDEEIESLLTKLGLDIGDNIMASYPSIWRERCQNKECEFCDWKF